MADNQKLVLIEAIERSKARAQRRRVTIKCEKNVIPNEAEEPAFSAMLARLTYEAAAVIFFAPPEQEGKDQDSDDLEARERPLVADTVAQGILD